MDIKSIIEEDLKKQRLLKSSFTKLQSDPTKCKSYGVMKGKNISINDSANKEIENRINFKSKI